MFMTINEKYTRYTVVGVILFIVCGLVYTHSIGKKQDEEYLYTYNEFHQAVELLKNNQFAEAKPLLLKIEKKHPHSFTVEHYLALSLANTGDTKKAARKMEKALQLNPYLSEDPTFMLQFAQILTFAHEKEKALIVLEGCKKLKAPTSIPDYQQQVEDLVKQNS